MDRRKFLTNLGIGAAVCAVVPIIDNTHEKEPKRNVMVNDSVVSGMSPKEILDFYRQTGILLIDENYQHVNSSDLLIALNKASNPRVL